MFRNAPRHRDGPASTGKRMTDRLKIVRNHHSPICRRKQLAPHESKDPAQTRVDLARRFFCAFCGKSRLESDLVGRDGALLFCSGCAEGLEALYHGAPVDVLKIFRGSRQC